MRKKGKEDGKNLDKSMDPDLEITSWILGSWFEERKKNQ